MGAVNRDSVLYDSKYVDGAPQRSRDFFGHEVSIRFHVTVVSAATDGDSYNVFQIPKGWAVKDVFAITDGVGASAGSGVLAALGTTANPDLLMEETDFDALEARGVGCFAGIGFSDDSADTTIRLTLSGAAPVVGKIVTGYVTLIAP